MSVNKARDEGIRWLDTAVDDVQTAQILRDNGKFAQCCFHCQQAAEKAVKAVYYCADQEPWGHSIFKLVTQLGDEGIAIPELANRRISFEVCCLGNSDRTPAPPCSSASSDRLRSGS